MRQESSGHDREAAIMKSQHYNHLKTSMTTLTSPPLCMGKSHKALPLAEELGNQHLLKEADSVFSMVKPCDPLHYP